LQGVAQTGQVLPEIDTYVKLSSDLRISFQAKETREAGDPVQAEIGPSLDFYLKPLIRLQNATEFDLDDSKSRPLVFAIGYRYLPQANNAPATNRMEPVVTFNFPMKARFLLSDRNCADCIGEILKHLDDIGEAENTIVIFTTDNGAEVFTWPDGGMTPFKGTKGTAFEGGFRVPAIIRWPGHVKPGSVQNGIISGLDWLPTLSAAAGNPNITEQLLKGVKHGDRTYKNHLDGYNQMALITGTGPSGRHELFYFAGPQLGALRIDDFKFQFLQQPYGWPGEKITTDMPTITNIRQDPFERTSTLRGETPLDGAFGYGNEFYAREFWRFVLVQQEVGKLAMTAIDYPPMQDPASFNLTALKAKIDAMIKAHAGQ
jgi:hypothetical protein